jgi:hypothetical protein
MRLINFSSVIAGLDPAIHPCGSSPLGDGWSELGRDAL